MYMIMSKGKKTNYNKRIRVPLDKKLPKLIIKSFEIKEKMDETGEVTNDTIIQISFEGIIINMSIATAMQLGVKLRKFLDIK